MTLDDCGITLDEFLAAYGSNNLNFDTTLFQWANGEFDSNGSVTDDCLDQVEFKRLFLFWFGDGNSDQVKFLDESIFPSHQGLMDDFGYSLHDQAD